MKFHYNTFPMCELTLFYRDDEFEGVGPFQMLEG